MITSTIMANFGRKVFDWYFRRNGHLISTAIVGTLGGGYTTTKLLLTTREEAIGDISTIGNIFMLSTGVVVGGVLGSLNEISGPIQTVNSYMEIHSQKRFEKLQKNLIETMKKNDDK